MNLEATARQHVPQNKKQSIEALARAGYAAKGAVYIVLGALALEAAILGGGQVEGGKGAVYAIGQQPFGSVLLVLLAIGLAGYTLWRVIQAIKDPENKGTDTKGIAARLGYAASAISHGVLCVVAVQLLVGSAGGGGETRKSILADVMSNGFGQFVVGALGVAIVGAGLHQLYKAKTTKFRQELKTGEMDHSMERAAIIIGRVGLAARGIVFPIMGGYLVKAAVTADASQAKGLGEALREISSSSFGTIMLAIVSAGLVAYGVYQLVAARYRKIPAPA